MNLYKVRPGARFLLGPGQYAVGGCQIKLEKDVAKRHAHLIEPIVEDQKKTTSKGVKRKSDDKSV